MHPISFPVKRLIQKKKNASVFPLNGNVIFICW